MQFCKDFNAQDTQEHGAGRADVPVVITYYQSTSPSAWRLKTLARLVVHEEGGRA
jgi:ribosomal protein L11